MDPVPEDPEPSSIGDGMVGALHGPMRISQPMIREGWLRAGPGGAGGRRGGDAFVAVSWQRALDLVADEIRRVYGTFGPSAVYGGSYGWGSAGRFHHAQSQTHRFLALAGGYTASIGSYSAAALEVILPHVLGGSPWGIWSSGPRWAEIAAHGELLVAFGGLARKNGDANSGGVGRHESATWQRRCCAAGVRFVNVSPVRDDAAPDIQPEWLAIRPATDVALMLGLAGEIVQAGRHDQAFLERCCVGADRVLDYLHGTEDGIIKEASWAAGICDIPTSAIRALARQIAAARTVINVSWSLQRQQHGEHVYWAAIALSAISGSMGKLGGGFAAGLGISQIGVHGARQSVAGLPVPPNSVREGIPVARIADALLHPGEPYDFNGERRVYPELKVIYWAGGNPFHHHQDLNRLVQAWQRPDTVVVHDAFWNPLCKHADVVFPVSTSLERDDLAIGFGDPTLMASERAVDAPLGVLSDFRVFAALAQRLGFAEQFTEGRDEGAWLRELYERTRTSLAASGVTDLPDFDVFWAQGWVTLPTPTDRPAPDLGALRAGSPLSTPSGRVELHSETIESFGYDDCPGHPTWLEPTEWLGGHQNTDALHLLSNQPSTRLHSQYDHGPHSVKSKIAGREPVRLNPADARARSICEGDVVVIWNTRGQCLAGAHVDRNVRPGVAVLSTGAWYDPAEPQGLDLHGNPNVLTADTGTSKLGQGPAPGTTLVRISKLRGTPPPVSAFLAPKVKTVAGS